MVVIQKFPPPIRVVETLNISLVLIHNYHLIDSTEEAEMDKDLIERNRELEEVVMFQKDTIQDQAMKIEVI